MLISLCYHLLPLFFRLTVSSAWIMALFLLTAQLLTNTKQFFLHYMPDLDLETVLWLQNYLIKTFKGTLVVVSHDRYFLNEVVTDVCHFHKSTLTTYRGDINNFTAVLEENKNRQIRLYEQQEAKREHLQKCKFHRLRPLFAPIVDTNLWYFSLFCHHRHRSPCTSWGKRREGSKTAQVKNEEA